MRAIHDRLMLQAALAVTFFGFLRVGEFTTTDISKRKAMRRGRGEAMWRGRGEAMRRGRFLAKQDVQLTPHKLTIKWSKTDQLGNRSIVTMEPTHEAICPVLAMMSYLRCCQAKPAAPLFHFESGRPLSARRLRSTLHSLLRQNGYDPGIHSCIIHT